MTAPAKKSVRKRATKKAPAKKNHQSLLDTMETIPIDSIEPFPGNARIGDLGIVVESLLAHGQFRPLLVQKSTNYIIAGNHTWQGMKHLKWETCEVTYLDVSDEQAIEINLIDNRASDKADYDWEALAEQLEIIKDTAAERTGWTQEEVDTLLALRSEMLDELTDESLPTADVESVDELPTGEAGVYKLDVNVIFPVENEWGIPVLKMDMILDKIPEPMTTWCGPVISEKDNIPGQNFMYVYSTDSTRGMPWHRTIMSFYIHDQRFENWWSDTDKYVERMLAVDLLALVSPDYSRFQELPGALNMWNVYRSAWIGRFAQDAGIKVIPNLSFDYDLHDWSIAHIPEGAPTVAVQVQTNIKNDAKHVRWKQNAVRWAVEQKKPQQLLVYAGRAGQDMIKAVDLQCEVVYVPNRSHLKDAWKEERDSVYDDGAQDG